MKVLILLVLSCALSFASSAQLRYKDSMQLFRQQYKEAFITDNHSPLSAEDTGYLRFFPVDPSYHVLAKFRPVTERLVFQMPTHSGKLKPYKIYGRVYFSLHNRPLILEVYQSVDLAKKQDYDGFLFIPFNDLTNYGSTYGGGRYLDLSIKDLGDSTVWLDFNKAYNPYCAYAEGYNCPIPPEVNRLHVSVKAGEKLFGKKTGDR